jgi:hypothetical protein
MPVAAINRKGCSQFPSVISRSRTPYTIVQVVVIEDSPQVYIALKIHAYMVG